MARLSRHRKRPVQKGVNAIFSGKARYRVGSDKAISKPAASFSRSKEDLNHIPFSRVLYAIFLIGIGLTLITGSFFIDLRSQQVSGSAGPRFPTRVASKIAPGFLAITNIVEMIVESGRSYNGTIATTAGDFLVVQTAYSEGGSGNLPDLSDVRDNSSGVYSRMGSASPGVGSNFWEQVWTGRASSSGATIVTIMPGWTGCSTPCVGSIIISMSIARYRDVGAVGALAVIASNDSSTSQVASVSVSRSDSVLVELLSHGAYNTCGSDAATPVSGQTLRSCFTGTTERTEFFDHNIPRAESFNESYAWSQLEVQRGIYLELDGIVLS